MKNKVVAEYHAALSTLFQTVRNLRQYQSRMNRTFQSLVLSYTAQ